MDYRAPDYIIDYLNMARPKTRVVKPSYDPQEPTSSGGDNNKSERSSSPTTEGEHSNNVRGIILVANNSSTEVMRDTEGNIVD